MVEMPIYLDVLQVSPHTIIRRICRLTLPGKVLVSPGDDVRPQEIVAEATLQAGVISLDIERGLGVSREEADACVLRKPGDRLKEGDLIAQCEGTLTRLIRSPADGTLLDVSRGKAVLATGYQTFTVQAGLIGVVEDIFPEYGIQLRVEGSLVQGEWGNGRMGEGTLQVFEETSTEEEGELSLVPGSILALNALTDPKWFRFANARELSGLVVGWMPFEMQATAADCAVPVLVLSGFGEGQMDPLTWDLLSSRTGEPCCVNATPADPFLGQRPELIIPSEQGEPEDALGFQTLLTPGQRVRILTGAAKGKSGKVVSLEGPLLFESGFTFPAATIDLLDGKQVQVPQQDMVILGN